MTSLRSNWTLLAVALLVWSAIGCTESPSRPANLVIVLVDTLRADRLGSYGNERDLTPFLDELALRGTVFANAYATSSWTCPSIASLFTSRYPTQHGVNSFTAKLSEAETTLAEMLGPRGYASAGYSANFRITEPLGYTQGFDLWRAPERIPTVRAPVLHRQALRWWDGVPPNVPHFLYLQYMEPHAPYQAPQPFRSRFTPEADDDAVRRVNADHRAAWDANLPKGDLILLESLYDGEVASLDHELRNLFDQLDQRGALENTIVVVTADHGEEFGEHGAIKHGRTLYDPALRVPLILLVPGYIGGRVEQAVSLVDVAPTIAALVGLSAEPTFEGRSLVPLLQPESRLRRLWWRFRNVVAGREVTAVLGELEPTGSPIDVRVHSKAFIRQPLKLLVGGRDPGATIYDLESDPTESKPLEPASKRDGSTLQDDLDQRLRDLASRRSPHREAGTIDAADRERLRALGYDS